MMVVTAATPAEIGRFRKSATEEIRVTLEIYFGREIVNIRTWWFDAASNEMKPSKKGIAFTADKLPELVSILQKALLVASPTAKPAA